ncbi:MAG: hypothetical protein WD848_03930 [Dehalococcoidia bacterium]
MNQGAPLFSVREIHAVDGDVEITLETHVTVAEQRSLPVLITEKGEYQGIAVAGASQSKFVFESVSQDIREAVLEFPVISVGIEATTSQPLADDVIYGPAGETLRVTELATGGSGDLTTIHYEPDDPFAPSVSRASVILDGTTVQSVTTESLYNPGFALESGSISFPEGTFEVMQPEDAILEAHAFRAIVKENLDVSIPAQGD